MKPSNHTVGAMFAVAIGFLAACVTGLIAVAVWHFEGREAGVITFLAMTAIIVIVAYIDYRHMLKADNRGWCVFDPENPDNQTIVVAPDSYTALGKAAQEVFGLGVEEVE